MDLAKCVGILQERVCHHDHSPAEDAHTPYCSNDRNKITNLVLNRDDENKIRSTAENLGDRSSLDLLNIFSALQGDRVKIYADFNKILEDLLTEEDASSYPLLCAEVTSLFAVLSKNVIAIKTLLAERSQKESVDCISSIQDLEREKLMLTAAIHLERLRIGLPSCSQAFGPQVPNQMIVYSNQVKTIEEKINLIMEELQALKCDLIS